MKKIFISIPWFDPAFKAGGPVQSIVNLVNSYQENVEYYIFCNDKDVDGSELKIDFFNKWVEYNKHTKVFYNQSVFPFFLMKKEMKIIKPDVLFIIGIFSIPFNIFPLLLSIVPQKILSVRGMLHPGALSQKKFKKKIFINFLKLINIKNRVNFHSTDQSEKEYILNNFGNDSSVYIAGNYPRQLNNNQINKRFKEKGKLNLISLALISPMKNHKIVLQALLECTGEIEYYILGAIKDHSYWKDCLQIIEKMPANIKVIIQGEIPPANITAYISHSDVMIMPSKSENFGHSIIESLYMGKPVITSNFTPWNELKQNNAGLNVNILVDDIKNAINYFVDMSDEEYRNYATSSITYAKKSIDLSANFTAYKNMFNQL
jgi:glycosyltransferase involved in cell wall biosynthesis